MWGKKIIKKKYNFSIPEEPKLFGKEGTILFDKSLKMTKKK